MARRRLVSPEIWAGHYDAPLDEREIARHYTLTGDDLEIVGRRRGDAARLGFAMLLLHMRWPGRTLEAGEVPPAPVLAYVARQLDVSPEAFADYGHRDQTRREHLVEIRRSHGFRIFDRDAFREVVSFSIPIAQTIIHPGQMAGVIVDKLRRRQILLASSSILEAVLRRARQQAELLTYEVLTNGLLPDTLQGLDDLLARRTGQATTWLSWLRNAPQSPAARNILRLIERLAYRRIGIMLERQVMIMNHKKLYRLYWEEGLSVRRRRKRARGSRTPMPVPMAPRARWSMDFVPDTFGASRKFRILAINDDCCRENLCLVADTSISGARVARELDTLVRLYGKPACIVSDNGTEFTSRAILEWAARNHIE